MRTVLASLAALGLFAAPVVASAAQKGDPVAHKPKKEGGTKTSKSKTQQTTNKKHDK